MMDLSDDDPHCTGATLLSRHCSGDAVVIERRIYVLGGNTTNVEVYDVDQGISNELFTNNYPTV